MSNDPKKQSAGKFRAAEMTDEEFERFYSEIYAEFGGQESKTVKSSKPAAGSGKTAQGTAQKKPQASRNTYADNATPVKTAKKVKKQKGVKGLVITACVEALGIVAVVLWWLLRIL